MNLGNGSIQMPNQPQVMIGVDQTLSAVVSDRLLLLAAVQLFASDVYRGAADAGMRAACDDVFALLDHFQLSAIAWQEAKKEAAE